MTKVIGFKHAKGNFKANDGRDIDYDNFVLYVVTNDNLPDGTEGSMCYELKIKSKDFTTISSKVPNPHDLINREVMLGYSMYGSKPQLSSITVISK